MPSTVLTRDGDVVDALAAAAYGPDIPGSVEAVLAANPVLRHHGPALPAGLTITLPDLPAPVRGGVVKLWD
jgi:phage tail protein X